MLSRFDMVIALEDKKDETKDKLIGKSILNKFRPGNNNQEDDGQKRIDPELLKNVAEERETMNKIERCIRDHGHPVQEWFYGHFHQSWASTLDGIRFSMLDVMEFKEVR